MTVLVICCVHLPAFALEPPILSVSTSGVDLSLSWTSVPGTTGYKLYYAPYPYTGEHTIHSADMETTTGFSATLWEGAAFFVAVTASAEGFESGFSNIELFTVGGADELPDPDCNGDNLDPCGSGECDESGGYWYDDMCNSTPEVTGWRWQNPMPTGNSPGALWGSGPDDIFGVGAFGSIIHYDGNEWQQQTSPSGDRLEGIWGSGPDSVFAVGWAGAILHYDGRGWTRMESAVDTNLKAVWGAGPDSVYTVGDNGVILHYDGSHWQATDSGTDMDLEGIWGSGPNDIFAVGLQGGILHYDGNDWSLLYQASPFTYLFGVWGNAADDVYAVGHNTNNRMSSHILHYNGESWQEISGPFYNFLSQVRGNGPDDIYAIGMDGVAHFDGSSWSGINETGDFDCSSLWGSSGAGIFVGGGGGAIHHFNGVNWSSMGRDAAENQYGHTATLTDIHGSGPDDVFAVGAGLMHFDGNRWQQLEEETLAGIPTLYAVWSNSGDDVYAAGYGGVIIHYDGNDIHQTVAPSEASLYDIWGSGADNVLAVGSGGMILRWDGTAWQQMESNTTKTLSGVWGASPTNIFAVGEAGLIVHYDGFRWAAMESNTSRSLYGVWGSGENDVFAVGKNGVVLHYDGSQWSRMYNTDLTLPFTDLKAVWGHSGSDVFAVGKAQFQEDSRSIFHYDGDIWRLMESGTGNAMEGVWGSSGNSVFAVGAGGAILHYSGG